MSTELEPPPHWITNLDGKKIRNPEHLAFMRSKWKKINDEKEEKAIALSSSSKELDADGIPLKYIRRRGKMVKNPSYVAYMKRSTSSLESSSEPKSSVTRSGSVNESNAQSDDECGLVDLSKDFEIPDPSNPQTLHTNPGARWIENTFSKMPIVRRVTVIENGKLVADFRNPGCDPDDTYNLWSTTKGIMSMLIGIVIEQTDLTLQDTLAEVFKDNHDAWCRLGNSLDELSYTKSVRIEELLTMSSGLGSLVGGHKGILSMTELSIADAAGSSLSRALEAPCYDPELRGKFHYLAHSNILSYVIKEKTGLSPLEFANTCAFPKLGIHPDKMSWESNSEGIETSFSQLKLTTHQMCKVGQLYLQDGYTSPDDFKPLFEDDWAEKSHSKHIRGDAAAGFDHWYGYLWSLYDHDYHCQNQAGDIWCAPGFNGQMIAISRETNRVCAISRIPIPPLTGAGLLHFKKCCVKLLSETMSYQSINDTKPGDVPKKFVRQQYTGKMIRNPEYNDYMANNKV